MNRLFIKILKKNKLVELFIRCIPITKYRRHLRRSYKNYILRNKIVIVYPDGKIKRCWDYYNDNLKIVFRGSHATVILKQPLQHFKNSVIELGEKGYFEIDSSPYKIELNLIHINNCKLKIGRDFSSNGTTINLDNCEKTSVSIGNDCMFSWDVLILPSDSHTIRCNKTKKMLNFAKKGVSIGNHVWLAHGVCILKESSIPDNTVVGMRSMVNKQFSETNTIIAGTPAKVIKRNISWSRDCPQEQNI
jgi:acetyltransferase-like isoleucine patch superfamily enzyme